MKIQCLTLCNFRLYDKATFYFHDGVNSIIGPNATGKTTLLEAIYCFITGHSFRTRQMEELLRYSQKGFSVEMAFEKHGIEQSLKLFFEDKKKRFLLNDTTLLNGSNLLGVIQGVVLTPDHIALVNGAPLQRRQFLDLQIAQTDPLYVHHLMRYTRALKQRNILLRAKKQKTLESWEEEMAASAVYLTQAREKAALHLSQLADVYVKQFTNEKSYLSLQYKSIGQAKTKEAFSSQFSRHRKREMELGMTITGPHRDDLIISFGEKPAREFASTGQKQTLVASLYLAKWERIRLSIQETPLMLVDDVGIGMDHVKKQAFIEILNTLGQVVLTGT